MSASLGQECTREGSSALLECTPWYWNTSKGLQANDVSARRGIHENRWHGSPPGEMPWRSKNLKAQRAGLVSAVRLALRNCYRNTEFPVSHRPLPPGKRNTCNAPATGRTIELVLAAAFNIPIDLSYAERNPVRRSDQGVSNGNIHDSDHEQSPYSMQLT